MVWHTIRPPYTGQRGEIVGVLTQMTEHTENKPGSAKADAFAGTHNAKHASVEACENMTEELAKRDNLVDKHWCRVGARSVSGWCWFNKIAWESVLGGFHDDGHRHAQPQPQTQTRTDTDTDTRRHRHAQTQTRTNTHRHKHAQTQISTDTDTHNHKHARYEQPQTRTIIQQTP